MQSVSTSQVAASAAVAQELISLFARLGLDVVVRDPDTADVVAATPSAEERMLAAEPGAVRIAAGRVAGATLLVELLPATEPEKLTTRQQEVANLLLKGMRNLEIAESLGISLHTVRRHLEQIFRRLGVNNRRDAIRMLKLGPSRH